MNKSRTATGASRESGKSAGHTHHGGVIMWKHRFLLAFGCLIIVLSMPPPADAQPIHHGWSDRYGDASSDYATEIAIDGEGNVIVAGYFEGTVDMGGGTLTSAGAWDIFVARFDAAGNHIWSKSFGDATHQYVYGLIIDTFGDIIIAGSFYGTVDFGGGLLVSAGGSDMFVAKFDASGNHVWSKRFGDSASNQSCTGIATYGSGYRFVLTGFFYGNVDFGGGALTSAGLGDVFVAKFDAAGNHRWSQRFGGAGEEQGMQIVVDDAGIVTMAGAFRDSLDLGGGALTSVGQRDIFVAGFDPAGNYLWSMGTGDTSDDYPTAITTDNTGRWFVSGVFYGSVDFGGGLLTSAGSTDIFVAGFDTGGVPLWSKRFGDSDRDGIAAISFDASGNLILAGVFEGSVDFGGGALGSSGNNDIYFAQLDADGSHMWSRRFGDQANQYVGALATDASENLVVVGQYYGTLDFGGGPLVSAGLTDMYVTKFWRAAPRIAEVRDLPGDQGGQVNVSWDASGADTPSEHAITQYTVWRAIEPPQVSSLLSSGATLIADASAMPALSSEKPVIRAQHLAGSNYYWFLMRTVVAYYFPGYSAPVATMFDSTSVSTEQHYFQVVAHTNDPYTFYASDPASGYSVDNLSPAAPLSLVGKQSVSPNGMRLSWERNTEADLSHYAVYRGLTADFTPGTGNLTASPEDTTSLDGTWTWNSGYYYKVSAVDVHDNESPYALFEPENVTGVRGSPVPAAVYLAQNQPNPFQRSTRIVFGLHEQADVSLRVYDVSGRLIRVLVEGHREAQVHDVAWDGTNMRGERVASGVYFYHLTAGGTSHIRKAVLLR